MENHNKAIEILGVGANRVDMPPVMQEIADGSMGFPAWWNKVGRMKSSSQWKAKLMSMGYPEQRLSTASVADMGMLLFSHTTTEGGYI